MKPMRDSLTLIFLVGYLARHFVQISTHSVCHSSSFCVCYILISYNIRQRGRGQSHVTYRVKVRERLKKMGHLQPLNIFLRQEIDRMRKVLTIVKATLTDLKLAIDGTIIMNEVRTS